MKTNRIIVALLLQCAVAGGHLFAQSNVDFSVRLLADRAVKTMPQVSAMSADNKTPERLLSVAVVLDDENAVSEVEQLGIEASAVEKNIIFAKVTAGQLDKLSDLQCVKRISSQKKRRALMNNARIAGNVNPVHQGTDIDKALTGKDVVVGIVDGGFDPNHIAFRSSDQSKLRVCRLGEYITDDEGENLKVTDYSPSEIAAYTTDDASDYHATHVTGIAAGAYSGMNGKASYQGVAPDADIYMCALSNYVDEEIIRAAQDIRDYAKAQGKPAVINMSLGYNLGPHDGTDAFNVALSEIAKDVPVCIAAGNEADLAISIIKTLTASDNTVRTSFTPNSDLKALDRNYQVASQVDIWSDDDTPFDVNVLIVDKTSGAVKYKYPVTVKYNETIPNETIYDSDYSYIASQKGLDSGNNRYYASVYMELLTNKSTWTTYPAIEVIGKAGQTIRMYNDGYYTDFATKRFTGYDASTPDGTINDMACGKYVIAVGAYNANLSGYPWVDFSSYGTLCDGRQLPHICAPGYEVISAMSTPYYESNYDSPAATFTVSGKKYYYGEMSGTSMATPFMTGTAAVWLQANPELTPSEIRNIAMNTAVAPGTPEVKWGAGRIDVFEGAKKAIESAGVVGVGADKEEAILVQKIGEGVYEVYVSGIETPSVSLYDITGRLVKSGTGESSSAIINVSDCNKGIYILVVRGNGKSESIKITI